MSLVRRKLPFFEHRSIVWRSCGDSAPLAGIEEPRQAGSRDMQPTGNRLLDQLASEQLNRLRPHLTAEALPFNKALQARGKPVESVWFPRSGMISIVAMMSDGAAVEVGIAGREGMLGVQVLLGDDTSLNEAMVQIPGSALRLPAAVLRHEADASPELRTVMLRYVQAFLNAATQSAACNRAHLLEQRLARWLLTARDRAGGDRLPLTHEFIAMMLGVRRAGVTVAAQSLQSAGLIHYAHGRITIVDREGLEVAACECYEVIKRDYARLLGIGDDGETTDPGLEYASPPRTDRVTHG